MKKIVYLFSIVLLLSFMVACGGGASQSKTELDKTESNASDNEKTYNFKFAHGASGNHPIALGSEKFSELVKEKSNGRINITIYPARQLGDEREVLENVINGSTEMAVVSTSVISAYTSIFDSLQLPFLLNTYDIEGESFKTDAMKNMLASLSESVGLKGFGVIEGGMRHLANNVKEVHTVSDLKGLKLRVVQSPLILDIFKELGASPTPMAYGEVYTALETGVIDGEEVNLSTITAEKHLEVLKHVTLAGQFPFPGLILMNDKIFKDMGEEDQKIMEEAAIEAQDYIIEKIKQWDEESLATIKEKGIKVVELENIEEFRNATQAIYDEYMAKDPLIEAFVKEVEKLK